MKKYRKHLCRLLLAAVMASLLCATAFADAKQRPAQLVEELHHRFNPDHLEQLHAHKAHSGKEVTEEPHDLTVEPVQQVIQDRGP